MESSRRVFLGSAAVLGVGSAAGANLVLFPKETNPQIGGDPVFEQIHKQLRDGVKGLRGPRPAESGRLVAATARIGAAHLAAKGVDVQFRKWLRAEIRRDGRQAFLARDPDPQMLAAEMRRYGVVTPLPRVPADYSLRDKALDELLGNGFTPQVLKAAQEIERVSTALDERSIVVVRLRQDPTCPDVSLVLAFFNLVATAACLFNPITCAIFAGLYAGLLLALAAAGCG